MPKNLEIESQKTLGPVAELEQHLPPQWWRSLFNALYLKTDGDVVENEDNTINDIDLVTRLTEVDHSSRIIDLCCGQGRHSLELARRGFKNVFGLDRSRYLIRLARRRSKSEGLSISFHEGDVRKFRLKEKEFDLVIIMGNSFGYFEQQDDDIKVLQNIRQLLKPGGKFLLDLTDGDFMRQNYTPRSWEWIDQEHLVNRERSLSKDQSRLISRELIIHSEKGVLADQFYAERLYSNEQIISLLEETGFHHIRLNSDVVTESTRNQDLGMMAQRLIIYCEAPNEKHEALRTKSFKNITVLLGDPSKPDSVKLDGKFNQEDIQTIQKLKDALVELKQFNFSYIDNHSIMLPSLIENKPDLVFNLCDEGFDNEATQELHIPAFLDMLKIPYTGAAPLALGICYDKSLTRAIAKTAGIPVPLQTMINPGDEAVRLPSIFPAILKPNTGDSSIGITVDSVVYNTEELVSNFNRLKQEFSDTTILVQEFLSGPEYSVSLIGNPGIGYETFPILKVDYSQISDGLPHILGYESKWQPDSIYWQKIRYVEASDLQEEKRRQLHDYSSILFERLGCRDYARFDYRSDANGQIKLLEVNPNPGWCWDGKFNLMAEMAGISYSKMLAAIINAAILRVEQKTCDQKISLST